MTHEGEVPGVGQAWRAVARVRPPRLREHGGQVRHQRAATVQYLSGRRPVVWLLGEAAFKQLAQPGGNAVKDGGLVQDPVHHRRRVGCVERQSARRGEGAERAEREDVGRRGDRHAADLLRRHALGRPHGDPGTGQPHAVERLGDPEVDHSGAVLRQQHVRRLEVAVHNPRGVDFEQRFGHAGQQQGHEPGRHRPLLLDGLSQGGTRHVRGDQPRREGVGVRVEQFGGVQPAHPPGGADLKPEPLLELFVLGQLGPD